jgi:hypothetical protein
VFTVIHFTECGHTYDTLFLESYSDKTKALIRAFNDLQRLDSKNDFEIELYEYQSEQDFLNDFTGKLLEKERVLISNDMCQLEILVWLRTQADCLYNNKLIELGF